MRSLMLAAIAALSFASISHAADAAGPYKLDSKGKCHAANGQFAKSALCTAPKPATNHCKDPKTKKFTKCTALGAVPA